MYVRSQAKRNDKYKQISKHTLSLNCLLAHTQHTKQLRLEVTVVFEYVFVGIFCFLFMFLFFFEGGRQARSFDICFWTMNLTLLYLLLLL